jgi:hypothetical protein
VSLDDTPLLPTPLYGLRTWSIVGDGGAERLAGPHRRTSWPADGAWLDATCALGSEHRPPGKGCNCGLHAWHPSRRSARRVLALRREVPGIVESQGAIEVHEDGFRAERARPCVLLLAPGRNARLVHRLAKAYGARVVEVDGAGAVLDFCRARGLGLDESGVVALLGPSTAEKIRRARRGQARADALRLAAAVAVAALLVVAGLQFATDPPGERVLHGRTGEIHINSR